MIDSSHYASPREDYTRSIVTEIDPRDVVESDKISPHLYQSFPGEEDTIGNSPVASLHQSTNLGFKEPEQIDGMKVYYNWKTSNKTFINLAKQLKMLGVKNYKFSLVLFDPDLAEIDPLDSKWENDPVIVGKIFREITINPWYYLREICRIPVEGGTPSRFRIHLGSASAMFLSIYNFNYYIELARQTGKTIGEAAYCSWLYGFGCRNSKIGFFNYSNQKVSENIKMVTGMLDTLPKWLQLHTMKISTNSKGEVKMTEKPESAKLVMSIKHDIRENLITGKSTGKTPDSAKVAGRGATQAKQNWDEIGWQKYNWEAYGSAAFATDAAMENAKRAGMPYGITMSSTPPDMSTPEGEWLYDLVFNHFLRFEPYMFDFSKEKLANHLDKNAKKDFFFISYQYNEIGFDEEWLRKRKRKAANYVSFRRDILLEWIKDTKNSPFAPIVLKKLQQTISKNSSYKSLILDDLYNFKIFSNFDERRFEKIIIGVDVSHGMGGNSDFCTMCGVDPKTSEVLFTFRNNAVASDEFAYIINRFVSEYCPNAVIVVERNNIGKGVIDNLKKSSVVDNLYYSPFSDSHHVKGVNSEINAQGLKNLYGIIQVQSIRYTLYNEILFERVNDFKALFKSMEIYDEITNLIITPKGKIDHKHGTHDDLLMAYLIAIFVLMRDDALPEKFGIARPFPEPDSSVEAKKSLKGFTMDLEKKFLEEEKTWNEMNPDNFNKTKTKTEADLVNQIMLHEIQSAAEAQGFSSSISTQKEDDSGLHQVNFDNVYGRGRGGGRGGGGRGW